MAKEKLSQYQSVQKHKEKRVKYIFYPPAKHSHQFHKNKWLASSEARN